MLVEKFRIALHPVVMFESDRNFDTAHMKTSELPIATFSLRGLHDFCDAVLALVLRHAWRESFPELVLRGRAAVPAAERPFVTLVTRWGVEDCW